MKTIIIIPTYNEAENIEKLLKEIFGLNIPELEVIVVDDNSPDGTSEIVEKLKDIFPIYLIKRRSKSGLGSAYIAGFKKALALNADYIFEMDADFSHDPKDLPKMLANTIGCDLVIGSRKIKGGKIIGWNLKRKLMSNGAMFISRLLLKLKPKDVTAGFRCYKKEVLQKINLDMVKSNGYAFQEEMLYQTQKLGFKICEVPVAFIDRKFGKSKLSNKDILEFFVVLFKLRFKK